MAWEARWGLKRVEVGLLRIPLKRLNGLGSPLGIETIEYAHLCLV